MNSKITLILSLLLLVTFWSCDKDDKDKDTDPVVEITDIYGISLERATIKTLVLTDVFSDTQRGIIWDTQDNPTLENHLGYMVNAGEIGEKTTPISGLEPGTRYFARVYVKNPEETLYSESYTFRTTQGVTDYEGNFYPTVIIGPNEWMAENLRSTYYSYGEPIPENGYVSYDNNPERTQQYGALYNWSADFEALCPAGWEVPGHKHWEELLNYTGEGKNEAGYLKSTRTTPEAHPRWNSPNEGATNLGNFHALPGGRKAPDNFFYDLGDLAYWWTSTPYQDDQGMFISLYHFLSHAGIGNTLRSAYFSIRCIKPAETQITLPTVETLTPDSVRMHQAWGGGIVISDGGAQVTQRGLVWSTHPDPTIQQNEGISTAGDGIGAFTSEITDLSSITPYYIRAYATNEMGTAYGENIRFITRGMVTDAQGNTYETVVLGPHEWMTKNLKVTVYNDGTPIPTGLTDTQWQQTQNGAYRVYPHEGVEGIGSAEQMLNAYGALYNWHAMQTGSLCPAGWRVPNNEDWWEDGLAAFIGGPINGYTLKSCRQVGAVHSDACATTLHPRWDANNVHFGTDLYGFAGLPAGAISSGGSFYNIGSGARWWNGTDFGHEAVPMIGLSFESSYLTAYNAHKNGAASVRCIRDYDQKKSYEE